MSDIVSMFEQKVDKMMEKMFGNGNSELKTITKLSLMKKCDDPEIKEMLDTIRLEKVKEEQMLLEEMTMTLDEKGNVVPLSPRQIDMKNYVEK